MTTVHRSRLIAAPADRVWAVVRVFDGLHHWVPSTPGPAEITGDPAVPGAERAFRRDGEIVAVERLVVLDDEARTTSYTLTKVPFPVSDHLATLTVTDKGDATLVEWEATFTVDPQLEEQVSAGMAGGTFEPGLQRLAELCEKD